MDESKLTKRKRRSADEARAAILAAAVKRLQATGPAGVKLAEIARDVGVSHPAVLHHFGSREGLLVAVVREALDQLHQELFTVFAQAEERELPAVEILGKMAEVLEVGGHARVIAWLSLSGSAPDLEEQHLRQVAEVLHQRRLKALPPGSKDPGFEDSLFSAMLATQAVIAEALFGDGLRRSAGLADDETVRSRYRLWLAELFRSRVSV